MIKELYIYNDKGLRAIQNVSRKNKEEIEKLKEFLRSLGDVRFEIRHSFYPKEDWKMECTYLKLKQINDHVLSNDLDYKVIPDGIEIFAKSVELFGINPDDFDSAYLTSDGSIIIEDI